MKTWFIDTLYNIALWLILVEWSKFVSWLFGVEIEFAMLNVTLFVLARILLQQRRD